MLRKIKILFRYLIYLFTSDYYMGHGIHSPFLFDFGLKVIFARDNKNKYHKINEYIKGLRQNNELIEIEDKGAGTVYKKGRKRKISSIAINSSTKKKYGKLLARLVDYLKPLNIIELGTSLGVGTSYLTINMLTESKLITIEGSESILNFSKLNCKFLQQANVFPVCGEFDDILPIIIKDIGTIDLVYFDGNHRKEPTLKYFEYCLTKISNNSVFVFDDIHWSDDMEEAWERIKAHPAVKISIDLFQLGILFFRKELSPQSYVIRF